jgi:hypothetical protein
MSGESELGIVLANAPRLERAFGRRLAVFIILISLYCVRRPSGFVGVVASLLVLVILGLQVWLKLMG